MTSKNFALIGAAGFVAPRHMKAIRDTGNRLLAAVDPHDSVGALDEYFPETRFFTEIERFDRYLEKLRRGPASERVDYVSICSPNFMHDAHVRLALRVRAHAICEKPLVIRPWNLDQLADLEAEYDRRVYTVLQLRLLPHVQELARAPAGKTKADVQLTYTTRRGPWYQVSWKGSVERSGGVAMNIGIHFFDLLLWLYGAVERCELHAAGPTRMAGALELERARVRWFLSIEADDLPEAARAKGHAAYRSLTVDGRELDLSGGFGDLHTRVYEDVLAGGGFGIQEVRPSIELVHRLNESAPVPGELQRHPLAP